jgi:MOSC domain-containing protein YiiM
VAVHGRHRERAATAVAGITLNRMRVLSICVGRPREAKSHGQTVLTSIVKSPVTGPVIVKTLNLEGDQQSDLAVHGGMNKAVYVYPSEHYAFWRAELPDVTLAWGAFGENLTTEGLLEDATYIGDRLRIGSAEFVVTVPRMPCYKLAMHFGRPDIVERFLRSGRSGFYLAVAEQGIIRGGDTVTRISRERDAPTVADVFHARRQRVVVP